MKRYWQVSLLNLLSLVLALSLAACAGALRWDPLTYTVEEGDTLYSIAFRHGLDYRALAEWNGIGSNYLIYPGDELVLSRPPAGVSPEQVAEVREQSADREAGRSSASSGDARASGRSRGQGSGTQSMPPRGDIDWQWPLEGEVLNQFGEGSMARGIQIAAEEGSDVHAAASGRVVYTGSGLIGYGKLIIIKHDDVYLSAYGHNQDILVEEGDDVDVGERIGRVGLGRGNRSMLHFEIRAEGQAVDPMRHLSD
ncbi:peptidoglycan DD-metalloendopeptidase family protein [Natronospira sp.]|uniref:peptidoglycan DD-metalloendopeptidase family protein n=1 Tax=Natronospira sp. TaxID=2024970 RepID=UPI00387356BD